ncbi:hypothetical protein B0H17DRAFT_840677, partial [Mycena rosella]
HTITNFTPPLRRAAIVEQWVERVADPVDGKRMIFMVSVDAPEGEGQEQKRLAGYVVLFRPLTETGPFRGAVEKLLVSPDFRRR